MDDLHHAIVTWALNRGERELAAHLPPDQRLLARQRYAQIRKELCMMFPGHEGHLPPLSPGTEER